MSSHIILLIEDDPDLSEVVEYILIDHGYQVDLIRDGTAAYRTLSGLEEAPNAVVLDMHLPGVSGADILNYLKTEARFAATRVLVTTADMRLAKYAEGKADVVCPKPFGVEELLTTLKTLVKQD